MYYFRLSRPKVEKYWGKKGGCIKISDHFKPVKFAPCLQINFGKKSIRNTITTIYKRTKQAGKQTKKGKQTKLFK